MPYARAHEHHRCSLDEGDYNDVVFWCTAYPRTLDIKLPSPFYTILDIPSGYVGLYADAFLKSNLRIPLHPFFCLVLELFKIHISNLDVYGCTELMMFIILCKAYDCEPSIDLFRAFYTIRRSGTWTTFVEWENRPRLVTEIPSMPL